MAKLGAIGVAVYVYRTTPSGLEFLQLHRSSTTAEYQQSWQICYGGIEPGETAVQAAIRELKEETGLRPQRMFQVEYLESFYFRPADCVTVMPVFAVEVGGQDRVTLNHEHNAHRWVSESQIDTHFMWRSQREAIANLLDQLRNRPLVMSALNIPLNE